MNNIRIPLIRAALATALIGGAFAVLEPPRAAAALTIDAVSVEAGAPLQAMLLPTVLVVADANRPEAATMRVVGDALPVTLMPTVHVQARGGVAATDAVAHSGMLAAAAASAPRLPALGEPVRR